MNTYEYAMVEDHHLLLDIGIQFLIVEPRLKKLIRREHDLRL